MMMTTLPPDIDLYSEPIAPDGSNPQRTGRHEAEHSAVMRLVARVFGPDARYLHHPDGAPYVDCADRDISVSHGARRALLAVSRRGSVGVDIEQWRPQLQRVSSRFLSPDEQTRYTTPEQLLQAWTAKEAVFKAARIPGLVLADIRLPSLNTATISTADGTATRHIAVTHLSDFPIDIAIATAQTAP